MIFQKEEIFSFGKFETVILWAFQIGTFLAKSTVGKECLL